MPIRVTLVLASGTTGEIRQVQTTDVVLAQDDWPPFGTKQIPFEVTSDFDGFSLDRVSTVDTKTAVTDSNGYVDVPLLDDGSIARNEVYLFDTQDRLLAIDVLRPLMRQSVTFSYENTARASVMAGHVVLFPDRQQIPDDHSLTTMMIKRGCVSVTL